LHVLGLPPAFILSQDQTLKLKAHLYAVLDVRNRCTSLPLSGKPSYRISVLSSPSQVQKPTKTVKLTSSSSDQMLTHQTLEDTIHRQSDPSNQTKPPTYLFKISIMSKSERQKRTGPLYLQRFRPPSLEVFSFALADDLCLSAPVHPLPRPVAAPVRFGEAVFTDGAAGPQELFSPNPTLFCINPFFGQNLGVSERTYPIGGDLR
jgi:hypothetical protein